MKPGNPFKLIKDTVVSVGGEALDRANIVGGAIVDTGAGAFDDSASIAKGVAAAAAGKGGLDQIKSGVDGLGGLAGGILEGGGSVGSIAEAAGVGDIIGDGSVGDLTEGFLLNDIDDAGAGLGGSIGDLNPLSNEPEEPVGIVPSGSVGGGVSQEEADLQRELDSGGNAGGVGGVPRDGGELQGVLDGMYGSVSTNSKPRPKFSVNKTFSSGDRIGLGNKDNLSPGIIGLPPQAYLDVSDGGNSRGRLEDLALATMPMVEIFPCLPRFGGGGDSGAGLQLFSLDPAKGKKEWVKIVSHCGFKNEAEAIKDGPLRIAFLNETSIGEQWSSSFGETMFEGMVNQGSNMAQSARMLTGTSNLGDAAKQIGSAFGGTGGEIGNAVGGAIGGAEAGIGRLFGPAGDAAGKLFSGSRVDFPSVWQGSSFEPSYNLTVRLYNPFPNDSTAYNKFILAPLCMILAMTVPMSDSKWTYNFPLFCKARCPGLFELPSAAFSSVRVIKGGDTNDVSWHQQPGTVDLQITLDSLFQTMIATTEDSDVDKDDERPTLKRYFDSLRDWVDYTNPYEHEGDSKDIVGLFGDSNPLSTTPQIPTITNDIASRVPSGATDIFASLTELVDLESIEELASGAGIMSGITDQLDGITGSVTEGFGGMTEMLTGSLSNFDVGGLVPGLTDLNGLVPEFTASGFTGASSLEKSLGGLLGDSGLPLSADELLNGLGAGASKTIGRGGGFPGGISKSVESGLSGLVGSIFT